jgi:opacity protein-like surface antigen
MHSRMRQSVILAIVLMWASAGVVSAQDKPKNFTEAVLFGGGTFTANGVKLPVLAAGIGGGWGERFTVIVDFSHSSLGDHATGFGSGTSGTFVGPVANSRLVTFSGNLQVDMIQRSTKPKFVPYATAGLGYVNSKFVATRTFRCFTGPPCVPESREGFSNGSLGFGGGAGLRVPLTRSIGVRSELKVWRVGGNQEVGLSSEAVVQASVGIYFRCRC